MKHSRLATSSRFWNSVPHSTTSMASGQDNHNQKVDDLTVNRAIVEKDLNRNTRRAKGNIFSINVFLSLVSYLIVEDYIITHLLYIAIRQCHLIVSNFFIEILLF